PPSLRHAAIDVLDLAWRARAERSRRIVIVIGDIAGIPGSLEDGGLPIIVAVAVAIAVVTVAIVAIAVITVAVIAVAVIAVAIGADAVVAVAVVAHAVIACELAAAPAEPATSSTAATTAATAINEQRRRAIGSAQASLQNRDLER